MKATIFIIAALLMLSTTRANDSNILLTGDTLPKNGQLTYGDTTFVMQDDCNLVLYNHASGFQSNTHLGGSPNCTLSLSNMGRFIITDSNNNNIVYTSPSNATKKGNYAAVLRPDGVVAVYGPVVFSTPALHSSNDELKEEKLTGNIPMVKNLMFSSQILYDGEALETRDYKLVMDADCDLKLTKGGDVVFESKTGGEGNNCFLRLDHKGMLNVVSDKYKSLWSSGMGGAYGDYVLIMQINGQAVVYGPVVWIATS